MAYESGNKKENGSSNVLGHDDDNTNGKDNEQNVINWNGNMSGSLKRNGYDDGIGKEQENGINREHESGMKSEHKNEIGREHQNGMANEHKNGVRIANIDLHQTKCGIAKGHANMTKTGSGNLSDHHVNCVALESFVGFVNGSLPVLPEFDALKIKPQDVAMVMLTSGTTGLQKAILLSHLNLQAQFIIAR